MAASGHQARRCSNFNAFDFSNKLGGEVRYTWQISRVAALYRAQPIPGCSRPELSRGFVKSK